MVRPRVVVVLLVVVVASAGSVGVAASPADGSTSGSSVGRDAPRDVSVPSPRSDERTADVRVTVETTPGSLPPPSSAMELAARRANGTLTDTNEISRADTMIVTLRASNLTGRLARYNGSVERRLSTFLGETDATLRAIQINPTPSLHAKEIHVLSGEATSRNATVVFAGRSRDTVHVAVSLPRVPVTSDAEPASRAGDDSLYDVDDGDVFNVGFRPDGGRIPRGANRSDWDQIDVRPEQVRTVRIGCECTVLLDTVATSEGRSVVRYAPGPDEPVPMLTPLAPGSVLTVTARTPAGNVSETVRVGTERVYGRWRFGATRSLIVPTFELPAADEPYEVTVVTERAGTVVDRETATVAPARATLDVPRQHGSGEFVSVRNVSLSHGGLLVLEGEDGGVLAVRRLPAGVHGRENLSVPAGVDVPSRPRVVAYRDVDLNGSLDPIDVPYREDGRVVASAGEYVTPSPTPTRTLSPTPESTATPTSTVEPSPTAGSTPTTVERVPGFGPLQALVALAGLVTFAATLRRRG